MESWKARHNQVTFRVLEIIENFDQETIVQKPGMDRWSIIEIIDHIRTINASYFPIFDALINEELKVGFMGKWGLINRFIGKSILKSVDPKTLKKQKTFPIWVPQEPGNVRIEDFKSTQQSLLEYLDTLVPFLNTNKVIHSPATKNVTYYLDTALEIIITHEERHLNQIEQLLQQT